MAVSSREHGSSLLARVELDRLDVGTADVVGQQLSSLLADRPAVVLDLSNVRYVDWHGLDVLLDVVRRCSGKVSLAGVCDELAAMLSLSQVSRFLQSFDTVEQALPGAAQTTATSGRKQWHAAAVPGAGSEGGITNDERRTNPE